MIPVPHVHHRSSRQVKRAKWKALLSTTPSSSISSSDVQTAPKHLTILLSASNTSRMSITFYRFVALSISVANHSTPGMPLSLIERCPANNLHRPLFILIFYLVITMPTIGRIDVLIGMKSTRKCLPIGNVVSVAGTVPTTPTIMSMCTCTMWRVCTVVRTIAANLPLDIAFRSLSTLIRSIRFRAHLHPPGGDAPPKKQLHSALSRPYLTPDCIENVGIPLHNDLYECRHVKCCHSAIQRRSFLFTTCTIQSLHRFLLFFQLIPSSLYFSSLIRY